MRSLTTAPLGEIDGAVLDDGTVIHWPPHLANRFAAIVTRLETASEAVGRMETGAAGDTHLEVETVSEDLRTNDFPRENDALPPGHGPRRRPLTPPPWPDSGASAPTAREASEIGAGKVQRVTSAPMGEIDGQRGARRWNGDPLAAPPGRPLLFHHRPWRPRQGQRVDGDRTGR